MANKKGVILIRFPEALADELRRASFESETPIKDIVSEIVEKNLLEWRREHAIADTKDTIAALSSLQERIAEYAARRSISVEQASDELGITKLAAKALADMEKIRDAPPDTVEKMLVSARRERKAAEAELAKPPKIPRK